MALADWSITYSKAKAHIAGHDTQTVPYLLELVRIDGLPKSKNGLEISVSFYDAAKNSCYGSTWRSLSVNHPFVMKQELAFHSEVTPATMLLVELIQIDNTTYKKQTLGWTALKLVNNNFSNKRLEIFHGSPRALFFMSEPSIANTQLLKREGLVLTMSLNQRGGVVRNLHKYLPANYLSSTSHLMKLNNSLQPATLFLENVEVHIGTEVKKFEDHILFLLMADAKQHNSNIRQFDKVTIKERRLKASVHNGLKYTDQFQVIYLENYQNTCLTSKGVISLSSIDSRNYIIFSLEYVLEVPVSFSNLTLVSSMRQSQVHIVSLRWGIWAPSGNLPNSGSLLHIALSGGPGLNPEKKLTFTGNFGPMNSLYDTRVSFKLVKQEGDIEYDGHFDTTLPIAPGMGATKSTEVDVPTVEAEHLQARQRMPQTPRAITPTPRGLAKEPLEPLASENILYYDMKTKQQEFGVGDVEKATYAQIHNAGFPDLVDGDGRPAIELDLAKHYVYSHALEKNDPRSCNSVFFQFLAVSFGDTSIKNMFFTVQFYRFVANTTPILSVHSYQRNLPSILFKQDKSDLHPGCIISYKINPGESTSEPEEFLKHIQNGNCIIDIWNSDSLFHVGSVSVKLKRLARQGEHGVQTTQVFNIHQDDHFVGKLHLRIANIGSVPDRYDIKDMETSIIIDLIGADENAELILRPKPLSNIDQNLASILNSESFQKSSKSRKMERMEAIRKQQDTTYIIPIDNQKTLRSGELTMIKNYRNKIQNDVIRETLITNITKNHTLYTEYGSVSYFEVLFINTSASDQVYGVQWDTPNIRLVHGTDECRTLKHLYNITTPQDEDVFSSSSSPAKLVLRPREQIYIPFTYRAKSTKADITHIMKFTNDKNSPIFVLNLCFRQKRQIINDRFLFYEAENTFAKHSINLSGGIFKEEQLKVRCSNENVICNVDSNNQIYFKAPVAGSNEITRFLLMLYVDKYCYRPCQVWEVDLFSLKRVDISAVVGSQTRFPVILRGTDTVRAVSCFTSNPLIIKVMPDREFVLMPSTIQEVKIMFEPVESGSRDFMINVVDSKHKMVIERWMVRTTATLPVISKTYDLPITTALTSTHKNISFTNPYQTTKTFRLKTNKPELVNFKSDELTIASNESQNAGLILSPHALSYPNHILVFLTDVDQKCEECFAIRVSN